MALRLIETILPENERENLERLLRDEEQVKGIRILGVWVQPVMGVWEYPVAGVWQKRFFENQIVVKVLLQTEQSEGLLDSLEERFSELDGFRVNVFNVEASLPRVSPEKDGQVQLRKKPPVPVSEASMDEERTPPDGGKKPANGAMKLLAEGLKNEKSAEGRVKTKTRISREELYTEISDTTRLTSVYVVTVVLSSIVAAIGILNNNVAVIIGAMVIAPLLGPNVALSLATTLGDSDLAKKALFTNLIGIVASVILSVALGYLLHVDPSIPEIHIRTQVGLVEVALALASGCAGALAFTTGASAVLIGVMVAVALLPPLVTFGLLLGSGYTSLAEGALLLFLVNFICVNLAGVATFLAQGVIPRAKWEAARAESATVVSIILWIWLLAFVVVFLLIRGL
ncbi:MAG: TIGR00341 family protein [Methanosarcinales archaeon]|nr:TIGR00341 family protein [Methanosarcinales archaeon]